MATIQHLLEQACDRLRHHDSPRLDAEVLLGHVLGRDRSYLFAWPEREVEDAPAARFLGLVARRARGEPVAYIVGRREFWSLSLRVTPDTLIPRPETELLVEQALARIPPDAPYRIADLATGSGAVALALAAERPLCRVVATDVSSAALSVAEENATTIGLGNVEFRQGSWYAPLSGERFQLLLSNPPYIPESDPHLAAGDVRFEPRSALASGPDGLDAIRELVDGAPLHLDPGGWLLLEHGFDQGAAICRLLRQRGFELVEDYHDLQGHGRIAAGRWRGVIQSGTEPSKARVALPTLRPHARPSHTQPPPRTALGKAPLLAGGPTLHRVIAG